MKNPKVKALVTSLSSNRATPISRVKMADVLRFSVFKLSAKASIVLVWPITMYNERKWRNVAVIAFDLQPPFQHLFLMTTLK